MIGVVLAGVLMDSFARQDFAFARGTTFLFDVGWKQSSDGGLTFKPVDLSSWSCRFLMYDQYDQPVFEELVTNVSSDGRLHVEIPAGVTSQPEWDAYSNGNWRVLATQASGEALSCLWSSEQDASTSVLSLVPDLDSGDVKLLACGYWKAF